MNKQPTAQGNVYVTVAKPNVNEVVLAELCQTIDNTYSDKWHELVRIMKQN